ncbi:MAG TPA: DUF1501 domain-containing protein [Bryobacteraceae bacterium]|nr:DUF1501 domain-containing protein [Bryobacteraceae bacterium]
MNSSFTKVLPTRRDLLSAIGGGFGLLGLNHLMAADAGARGPHFPPKAKHVIYLFLNGGPSQVDTFDPKPMLTKYHGKAAPTANLRTERKTGTLLGSPFQFHRCGQSGIEVSEIFSELGKHIDDICVIRSMHTERPNHEPSLFMLNCGHVLPGHPSMGSWLNYGLGTANQNLPGFVVLCPGLPVIGPQLWTSAYLPPHLQGTHIPNNETEPEKLIQHLRNKQIPAEEQRKQLDLLAKLNKLQLKREGSDPQLEGRIESMEIAYRMQTEAFDAFDINKEPLKVRERYGDGAFARGCLLARRLVERGVRMVQVYYGDGQPWDNHDDILIHKKLAQTSDKPMAALLEDLKNSGLLKDTLVIIGGEFGRTPAVEVSGLVKFQNGRDHNNHGFSMLLAGGGIKGGTTYGNTDEFGFKAVENPVHPHDVHATALHLLGLDHTRLTYRYSGRDFRLTDVFGKVIQDILA